jgi:hypothetical protein
MRMSTAPATTPSWTVYRIETASSVYHLGVYPEAGRRRVVLRSVTRPGGQPIDVESSDPRVEGFSLFEVPCAAWIGRRLEIGTVTTSPVRSVAVADDGTARTALTGVSRTLLTPPSPISVPATPVALAASGIRPARRGRDDDPTSPSARWEPDPQQRDTLPTIPKRAAVPELDAAMELEARESPESSQEIRRDRREPITDVPPAPYPESMLLLMESAARRLRTVHEAHTLLEDLAGYPELRARFEVALAECHLTLSALGGRLQRKARG